MKRFLAGLFVLCSGYLGAQCTPDLSFTQPGVYPDSTTNLATAYVGQPYEDVLTAVVPADTCVVIVMPPCTTVPFDSVVVTGITGLPPNFTYECDDPDCRFLGGTSGCMRIYSTSNPGPGDIGTYNLSISLIAYVPIVQQPYTVDYYKIEVVDSSGNTVPEFEGERIRLDQNIPNPVSGITSINFVNGTNSNVTFQVLNLLGEVVYEEKRFAKKGNNSITYNAGSLKAGVYLYVIDNGYVKYSRKMMVK